MIIAALAALIALVGAGVVYLIRSLVSARVDLGQRGESLRLESDRLAREELAAESARDARRREFDAKAATVRSADDAARLLRDVTDDPGTN